MVFLVFKNSYNVLEQAEETGSSICACYYCQAQRGMERLDKEEDCYQAADNSRALIAD